MDAAPSIGGLVGWWVGGLVDWWVGGLVDWWIGGLVGWWIGGLVDWWIGRGAVEITFPGYITMWKVTVLHLYSSVSRAPYFGNN